MAKRGNPTKGAVAAKVGNYMAEVDTTGMDPSEKAMFRPAGESQWDRVDKSRRKRGLPSLPKPGSKEYRR